MFESKQFSLGQVVLTRGVNDLTASETVFYKFVAESLEKHSNCDWGTLSVSDKKSNDNALKQGLRLLSAYKMDEFPKIWIITESDRSATTVLFPDEY